MSLFGLGRRLLGCHPYDVTPIETLFGVHALALFENVRACQKVLNIRKQARPGGMADRPVLPSCHMAGGGRGGHDPGLALDLQMAILMLILREFVLRPANLLMRFPK